ncbi:poly-beta-1,6 N-acetyl-D-glucosamine synthase, partial [Xenorhabdus bovienii]|nr:poly-beta-1,6 N-acetyl-D-glucosamine synthase [Xenorhabdus bovienii]
MIDRILAFIVLCLVLGIPLGIAIAFTGKVMMNFVFFWPLFMSAIWISGGIYFWFYRERHWKLIDSEVPRL